MLALLILKAPRDTASNTGKAIRTTTPRHLLRLFSTYTLPGDLHAWSAGGGVNLQSEITSQAFTVFARQHSITLNTLVQGAWALLLQRYSGQHAAQ